MLSRMKGWGGVGAGGNKLIGRRVVAWKVDVFSSFRIQLFSFRIQLSSFRIVFRIPVSTYNVVFCSF